MSTRDQRFVANHRGGPLARDKHVLMAAWAADCAEHVLPLFENASPDRRPRTAVNVARAWARGEVSVGEARQAATAAHAAAREATNESAIAAARAAGHAVATAHMADHCLGIFYYTLKALQSANISPESEVEWQIARLPADIRPLVLSGLNRRYPKLSRFLPAHRKIEFTYQAKP